MFTASPCSSQKIAQFLVQFTCCTRQGQIKVAINGIQRRTQLMCNHRNKVCLHTCRLMQSRHIPCYYEAQSTMLRFDRRHCQTDNMESSLKCEFNLDRRLWLFLLQHLLQQAVFVTASMSIHLSTAEHL